MIKNMSSGDVSVPPPPATSTDFRSHYRRPCPRRRCNLVQRTLRRGRTDKHGSTTVFGEIFVVFPCGRDSVRWNNTRDPDARAETSCYSLGNPIVPAPHIGFCVIQRNGFPANAVERYTRVHHGYRARMRARIHTNMPGAYSSKDAMSPPLPRGKFSIRHLDVLFFQKIFAVLRCRQLMEIQILSLANIFRRAPPTQCGFYFSSETVVSIPLYFIST